MKYVFFRNKKDLFLALHICYQGEKFPSAIIKAEDTYYLPLDIFGTKERFSHLRNQHGWDADFKKKQRPSAKRILLHHIVGGALEYCDPLYVKSGEADEAWDITNNADIT
jgi:hypothetical protein